MSKILVTGANGQLGSEIREIVEGQNKSNFIFTDKNTLDITDFKKVEDFCKQNNITHIINCAAYTKVDKAEKERELADLINYKAVENLAKISKANNITLIHFSTDYVFNGKNYKPYVEEDELNPINYYGDSKLKGEKAFLKINPKGLIIRTSWVYSKYGNNFVKTMLKLSKMKKKLNVIFDQVGTPTFAKDLAKFVLFILEKKFKNKIYHYNNEGVTSWYDFAKAIFEISGINIKVNPIETKEYPTPAKRPFYSVLNKFKVKKDFDIEIPYWRDSLKDCIKRLNNE